MEEYDRGQPRLSQHPATVDLKYGPLFVVGLLGERVLNVPLSWQLRPQCWHTFLEDHSTWPPDSPRRPQHTSAPSRPLLLLFLASFGYFSCVFFLLLYILCSLFLFYFFFFFPLPPLPPCHWSLSVFEVHWTKSLWRTEGFSASLALEQGLFLPVTSRGPRCVAGQSSCVPSSRVAVNLRKVQVCCLFFSQPGAAKEQVAMSGDLLGQ